MDAVTEGEVGLPFPGRVETVRVRGALLVAVGGRKRTQDPFAPADLAAPEGGVPACHPWRTDLGDGKVAKQLLDQRSKVLLLQRERRLCRIPQKYRRAQDEHVRGCVVPA